MVLDIREHFQNTKKVKIEEIGGKVLSDSHESQEEKTRGQKRTQKAI